MSNSDDWSIDQWKTRNHELELLVAEKTADLAIKNRELEIEAGLDKVRTATMAMQSSEDVSAATAIVFNEISLLGVEAMRCGVTIIHPDMKADVWAATTTSEGKEMKGMGSINFGDHPLWTGLFDAWKNKKEDFAYFLKGDDLRSYYNILSRSPNYDSTYIQNKEFPDHYFYACLFKQGAVFTFSILPHPADKRKLLGRFTSVFSMTFRRYLDLQKAEAQAREAEIQLALERIRTRTMAMQKSEELAETCQLLIEEFRGLDIIKADQHGGDARVTIGILNEDEGRYELWATSLSGLKPDQRYYLSLDEPINIAKAYKAWKEGRPSLVIDMQGENLHEWLRYLEEMGVPIDPGLYNKRRIYSWAFFSKGNLGIATIEPLPEESVQLLCRFADTFNITYTRFQDLKDAELRTEVAIKEASLDRIRAEIASMRTAEDLQRITPSLWRELTTLDVPFFRCGVMIVDEEKQLAHFYLTTPDGKPLAALELSPAEEGFTKQVLEHWRGQQTFVTHWDSGEFRQFAQNLVSRQQIPDIESYQGKGGDVFPPLTLQFLPFPQGMLYVGSENDLPAAQMDIVSSLANAFSTAYSRYEDFTRLEAAKQQIETTLKDLRDTQHQLIHSEKMASLGELTAGIAHEIQNPLNFVNNFSEVSVELIDEMKTEILHANLEEAKSIAEDLRGNLEKINRHGRRAGDIVKGMLLHSRKGTGQKEQTDINALCDEYVRLAYHGLRAKDKSFNAHFELQTDPSTGKIAVIAQDIGRLILNLINNAFYAVTERKKQQPAGYEPKVTVRTHKTGDSIIITIEDNGIGIPQKIVDKIFQPFFTTKPTGQGTGLGLSLSYDIVKAHNGELKVETAEGAFTRFIIALPVA